MGKVVLSFLLAPLLAFLVHYVLFTGVDRPPGDHGTGSMFDLIATRYDMINRVLALGMDIGWRQEMVQEIKSSLDSVTNPRILDVSTGTADVALLLASAIPQASVVGIDPSQKMLDIGKVKVKKRELDQRIDLQQFDARDLASLPESSFHAATMAFGIRNVPERDIALCQIHRLLEDESRFCILEFSEPDDSFGILGNGARIFIRHVIPFLGGILSGAPREYWHLQNSIKNFPKPAVFSQQIDSLTCESGTFRVERVRQLCFGSVQIYIIAIDRAATQMEPPAGQADKPSEEAVDASQEAVDASPETVDASPETVDASPETVDASPELGDVSPEAGDASPELVDASREAMDVLPEAVDASPEAVDASREAVDASQETVDASQETEDASQETEDASQETEDVPLVQKVEHAPLEEEKKYLQ